MTNTRGMGDPETPAPDDAGNDGGGVDLDALLKLLDQFETLIARENERLKAGDYACLPENQARKDALCKMLQILPRRIPALLVSLEGSAQRTLAERLRTLLQALNANRALLTSSRTCTRERIEAMLAAHRKLVNQQTGYDADGQKAAAPDRHLTTLLSSQHS